MINSMKLKLIQLIMKTIFFILATLFLVNSSIAQDLMVPADLKHFVDQSFEKYPKVAEMKQLISLSETKVQLDRTAILPTAMGDLSYRQQFPTPAFHIPSASGQIQEMRIQPADNYNASVSLAQPLIDFRLSSALNKAKGELEISKDNLEGFKVNLAYQIAQVYYSIIFLNKSITVQQEQLNLITATKQQIEVRVKNGDALNYDQVSTDVKYNNAVNFYTELKSQLSKQYNLLDMLTGNSGQEYIRDAGFNATSFTYLSDSISAIASHNNMDIRIADAKLKLAGWDILTAERSKLPSVNLLAGAGYKNGFMPNIDVVNFNYFVGLGVTIPILSASRPGFRQKMAVITRDATQHALETQKATLNKDLLNALDDIQKNQKKLSSADGLIKQAKLANELAADRYKFGVITNLDLLTAVSNLSDAQLSKLQFEYNLLLSRMDLCRLAGLRWW